MKRITVLGMDRVNGNVWVSTCLYTTYLLPKLILSPYVDLSHL